MSTFLKFKEGNTNELRVVLDLMDRGFHVLKSFNHLDPFDLGIYHGEKFFRVEVTTGHYRGDIINIYKKEETRFDILAVSVDKQIIYHPPLEQILLNTPTVPRYSAQRVYINKLVDGSKDKLTPKESVAKKAIPPRITESSVLRFLSAGTFTPAKDLLAPILEAGFIASKYSLWRALRRAVVSGTIISRSGPRNAKSYRINVGDEIQSTDQTIVRKKNISKANPMPPYPGGKFKKWSLDKYDYDRATGKLTEIHPPSKAPALSSDDSEGLLNNPPPRT